MKKITLWAWIVLPTLSFTSLCGAEGTALKVSDAKVQIEGESTLHKFQADASTVTVHATLKDGAQLAQVKSGALKSLELVVLVDSLQSDESKRDKTMHGDLGSDKTPNITFKLKHYAVKGATVTAQGSLNIHGVTKDVTLTGILATKGDGLSLSGSYGLKMSDYAVQPPVIMLGTIKVKDEVTVRYSFNLGK